MTLEDKAFNGILRHIEASDRLSLLSAHPPSGKSYNSDLIRIPSPQQDRTASTRAHIDIIFCSKSFLYLCEVKGDALESDNDIKKLRAIVEMYGVEGLKRLIANRLTHKDLNLRTVQKIIPAIGCASVSCEVERGMLYIIASDEDGLILKGMVPRKVKSDFNLSQRQL